MKGPDGKMIPPTNKSFHVEFCTVAKWENGEIVEERLFYDLVGFMQADRPGLSAQGVRSSRRSRLPALVTPRRLWRPRP